MSRVPLEPAKRNQISQDALNAAKNTSVKVGSGSGVIVGRDSNGVFVVTNAHVVGSFNNNERVMLPDGTVVKGKVVKNNNRFNWEGKGDDLAIVYVPTQKKFGVAKLGPSELPRGEFVLQAGFSVFNSRNDNRMLLTPQGLNGISTQVVEDRDPRNQNPGNRLQGSYEIGLNGDLGSGSSGGGSFDRKGLLVGLNGRSSNGHSAYNQNNKIVSMSKDSTSFIIDTQTIGAFLKGVVPGY